MKIFVLPPKFHADCTLDAVFIRVVFPAGAWLYNHFLVGGLGVDDSLYCVTWPQPKSAVETVKTGLTGTGMCLPSCSNVCKMLERALKSDT